MLHAIYAGLNLKIMGVQFSGLNIIKQKFTIIKVVISDIDTFIMTKAPLINYTSITNQTRPLFKQMHSINHFACYIIQESVLYNNKT